jgi:hypothetical protein
MAVEDAKPQLGECSIFITVTAAADEFGTEYYRIYMVSRAGFQLEAIGNTAPAAREPRFQSGD